MKKIINHVLLVFVLCAIPSVSFSADSDIWVAVTVFDGRNIGTTPEYYGKMSQSTLQQLTSEVKEGRMFKLSDVFWTDDEGKAVYLKDAKKHGRSFGYTNDVVLRADRIYRIIIVDGDFIKKLLKQ
jgi:hypothetical protein